VSSAFAEDPVRILRLARFAARFTDFSVADDTRELMRRMVAGGEVDALVPERVWQELARGLMEARPSRMLEVLRDCGALARLLPELDRLWGVPQPAVHHPEIDTGAHMGLVIDVAARMNATLPARWAALLHDLGKGTTPPEQWPRHIGHEARSVALVEQVCARLRVPADCRDLAVIVAREHGVIGKLAELRPATVLEVLERCDALRRPERFAQALDACEADSRGRTGFADRPFGVRAGWQRALAAARAVDAGAIAQATAVRRTGDAASTSAAIAAAVRQARVDAVRAALGPA
jgi:tRNA nucleotidyltransferase (CCA-adding enzyme)